MLPCLAYTELLASPVNAFNFEKTRQLCKMVVDFVNPLFSDSNSSLWQKLRQLRLIFFFCGSPYLSAVTSKKTWNAASYSDIGWEACTQLYSFVAVPHLPWMNCLSLPLMTSALVHIEAAGPSSIPVHPHNSSNSCTTPCYHCFLKPFFLHQILKSVNTGTPSRCFSLVETLRQD